MKFFIAFVIGALAVANAAPAAVPEIDNATVAVQEIGNTTVAVQEVGNATVAVEEFGDAAEDAHNGQKWYMRAYKYPSCLGTYNGLFDVSGFNEICQRLCMLSIQSLCLPALPVR